MTDEMDEMNEIIQDFVMETSEVIDALDNDLISLENSPDDLDLINKIFRSVHTIKGAAGFLGFTKIVDVVHNAENLLNKCRQGDLKVTPPINDVILKASDTIKILLGNIRNNEEMTVDVEPLILEIKKHLGENAESTKPGGMSPDEIEATMKAAMDDSPTAEIIHDTGSLMIEELKITDEELAAELSVQVDVLPEKNEDEPARDPDRIRSGDRRKEETFEMQKEVSLDVNRREQRLDGSEGNMGRRVSDSTKIISQEQTIRVDVQRLDEVMNLVGELVLGRNRMFQIGSDLELKFENDPLVQSLMDTIGQVYMVTSDLQLSVMKTRMQPIKKVFTRFPRMVRDLAKGMGKEINLQLEGEDTELDKSVIEEIGDPMVHLVRNAVDHGLETVAEREKAGKPREGNLTLSAFHEGNSIIIEVQDDGKGIDAEVIGRTGVEKGIIQSSEFERMTDRDKLNLVFTPGFSTAAVTTDISGRGVGMDVVKTNVLKLGGTISINTKLGEGTTFSIKLPLTVAIIQALMVQVGKEFFALPLVSVVETVRTTVESIQSVEQSEVIHLREEVLPLVRLEDLFDIDTSGSMRDDGAAGMLYVVVIAIAEKKVGIVVERLLGQEEVVIKSLGKYMQPKGIAGATILGNGNVTLIVDLAGLVDLVDEEGRRARGHSSAPHVRGKAAKKKKKILLVDDSQMARKAQRRVFEDHGFSVIEAENGTEGLSLLESDKEVGVILTDIIMPQMDGIEMTKKIKANVNLKSIPVIALSVVEEEGKRTECYQAGIESFHDKTDISGVLKTIRKYIN
jgi:two-component system chemotaxis sensor kinase CheA